MALRATHTGVLMIVVDDTIREVVRTISRIARQTLLEQGSHLPTAVLHTVEGMVTIVLPFKDDTQKRALVDYVRRKALECHAFAVTTVTCAQIVDARSGDQEEALVLATAIQGGKPYYCRQSYIRDQDRHVIAFGELVEGDHAAMPGQMMILPNWEEEISH